MIFNKPDLTRLWAGAAPPANVVDPDSVDPGKYAEGWIVEVPPLEYFNFLQQQFSGALGHINQRGFADWDTNTEYVEGAVVRGSDGFTYMSVTSPNTGNNPVGDLSNTNWLCAYGLSPGTVREIVYDTAGAFTYTPDIDVRSFEVECIGGGGGAGDVTGAASGSAASTGGGGGAYARSLVNSAINYATGYSGVVGIGGGVGGVSAGATTFIDNDAGSPLPDMTAGGGSNGADSTATGGDAIHQATQGGFASGGTEENITGTEGGPSNIVGLSIASMSTNGYCARFPITYWTTYGANAVATTQPGQGGISVATFTNNNYSGSNGHRGAVIIKEYR